jgi:FkbM family methyltransferase
MRRQLARRFPSVAAAYHTYRLARQNRSSGAARTPYGFLFDGPAMMQAGEFETGEAAVLQRLLAQADTFIDVGANVGFFSCLALHLGRHVIAIEPPGDNLQRLMQNIVQNRWDGAEIFPIALGRRAGIGTIFGDGTGASLVPGWSGTSDVWKRLVPVTTLDTLLASRPHDERLVVKIDVEGFELDVLDGAQETMRRSPKPAWLVEICLTEHHSSGLNPNFMRTFERFWQAGYEAATAAEIRQAVTRDDVSRWVDSRRRDFGSINYVFEAARPHQE